MKKRRIRLKRRGRRQTVECTHSRDMRRFSGYPIYGNSGMRLECKRRGRVDECWIIAAHRAVDALGDWPRLQKMLRCGTQKLDAGGTVEPRTKVLFLKKHGHAVVNAGRKSIRVGDNDCAGEQEISGFDVQPVIPKAGDRKYPVIQSTEIMRLLGA